MGTSVVVHDGERFVAKTKLKVIKQKSKPDSLSCCIC